MSLSAHINLWIECSEDGDTLFTEIADILDALGRRYEGVDASAAGFLFTRALQARKIDRVYEQKTQPWSGGDSVW